MFVQIGLVFVLAVSMDELKYRNIINQKYIEMQKKQYKYMSEINIRTKRFRHDVKSHMLVLKSQIKEGKYEEAEKYISDITQEIKPKEKTVTIDNSIADAIINQYIYEAKNENVQIKVTGLLYENCEIDTFDLCVIFSNLLSNAIEAAKTSKNKIVTMNVKNDSDTITILVKNSYSRENIIKGNKYLTTKADKENHGMGIENIRNSVNKYDGIFEINDDGQDFSVYIRISK